MYKFFLFGTDGTDGITFMAIVAVHALTATEFEEPCSERHITERSRPIEAMHTIISEPVLTLASGRKKDRIAVSGNKATAINTVLSRPF